MKISRINADISALENQIDEMIYALYGLTPEEVLLTLPKNVIILMN